jgi:hypothetical protein
MGFYYMKNAMTEWLATVGVTVENGYPSDLINNILLEECYTGYTIAEWARRYCPVEEGVVELTDESTLSSRQDQSHDP